jgi:hypothetical protein
MKAFSFFAAGMAAFLLLALPVPSYAGRKSTEMEVRITGDAVCAKCVLKQSDHCQILLQFTTVAGKLITYYLDDNDVARSFHDNVSKESRKVKATGVIRKSGSKLTFEASEILLVK